MERRAFLSLAPVAAVTAPLCLSSMTPVPRPQGGGWDGRKSNGRLTCAEARKIAADPKSSAQRRASAMLVLETETLDNLAAISAAGRCGTTTTWRITIRRIVRATWDAVRGR